MGVRMSIFGVDVPRFERVVDQLLYQILQTILAGNQDFAKDRPRLCLLFDEPEGAYYLERGRKIFVNRHGERTYIDPGLLHTIPELQLTARAYIRSGSGFRFNWLMNIISASDAYASVKTVVDGHRRWWIGILLEAFSNWFGPESSDCRLVSDLFTRLLRRYGDDSSLDAMPFPVLPADDSDRWMAAWTAAETGFALSCMHVLWEETASLFAHQEAWKHIQGGYMGISAEDTWTWVNEIVQGFFDIEALENASIVSFIG